MKHILLLIIAAVALVGCGKSKRNPNPQESDVIGQWVNHDPGYAVFLNPFGHCDSANHKDWSLVNGYVHVEKENGSGMLKYELLENGKLHFVGSTLYGKYLEGPGGKLSYYYKNANYDEKGNRVDID